MIDFDALQTFLETCATETDSDSIAEAFRQTIEELGFRYFACCSHVDPLDPPDRAVLVHNYPADWVKHFGEAKLHRIDPVFEFAQRQPLPFFWDAALRAQPLSGAQKEMIAEATAFGIEHGYTVPIHLSWTAGSLPASCSVIPDSRTLDSCCYFAVQTLATHLYAALDRARAPAPELPQLSQRERDCLALAAQGKDDWSIAQLLGLSENTVHTHIKRGMRRFRVCTRVQAAMYAVLTRQISVSLHEVAPGRAEATGTVARTPFP